jgi:hypothetical protein
VVPKSTPGAYRYIHDLSFPEGSSVNCGIPDEASSCAYGSLDAFVEELWSHGKGSLLAKIDVKEAYKHVRVRSEDQLLLGSCVRVHGTTAYYYDTVLPFGLKTSARIFIDVTEFMKRVMLDRGASYMWSYSDDFATVGAPGSDACMRNLDIAEETFFEAGFELSNEKREGPATRVSILGWEIDSTEMSATVPEPKRSAITILLQLAVLPRKAEYNEA